MNREKEGEMLKVVRRERWRWRVRQKKRQGDGGNTPGEGLSIDLVRDDAKSYPVG